MRRAALTVPLLLLVVGCQPDVSPPPHAVTVAALFDPLGTPPVIPLPNDLLFTGGDGVHLNVPDLPTDSPAQLELNAYLRTLDGFPSTTTGSARFGGALDPASVQPPSAMSAGSVVVIDQMAGAVLDSTQVKSALSPDGTTVTITPVQRWKSGDRYAVLLFGGSDPAGLKGKMGELVVSSPTFFFLRSPGPLLVRCGDLTQPECLCPQSALMDPNDMSCHSSVRGLPDAQARAAEIQRQKVAPALDAAMAVGGMNRSRSNVVLFWTFTITDQPMTVFDPDRGDVPFPNDVLINPMSGLVSLPIAPGDPQAALKMQLNTLDGFSTSAAETVGVDAVAGTTIDQATLIPNMTVFLANLAPVGDQPKFAAAFADGKIGVQPLTALIPDQDKYAVVLTRRITDSAGRALVPPPSLVLATGQAPLFDGMHSTVSVLSDSQAAQLEMLRLGLQPLLSKLGALGLDRSQLAALWTFTTQSIARPLLALDQFPTAAALPTAVTITKVAKQADLNAAAASVPYPVGNLQAVAFGTFESESVIDPAAGQIVFTRTVQNPMVPQTDLFAVKPPASAPATTIAFWISVPKSVPPGGAPVVILQHGFTQWRGQMISLADNFAQAGFAAIAIDIDDHGARSRCTSDMQCVGGGKCDTTTGVCATGLALVPTSTDPLSCALAPIEGVPTDCRPVASGVAFINPNNLFLTRANGQQYVVDAAQLVRVLEDTSGTGLAAQLAAQTPSLQIDASKLAFLGHSLGGIEGSLFLAAAPQPAIAVLNATGGHDFDNLASGGFKSLLDQYLMSIGVMRGTPEFEQLRATADWVFDAIDPFCVGQFVRRTPLVSYLTGTRNAPKVLIQQETGMDMVILPPFQEVLGPELFGPMGLDANHHLQGQQNDGTIVSTYFPNSGHSTLIYLSPDAAGGASMRRQAITFIATAGATLPAP